MRVLFFLGASALLGCTNPTPVAPPCAYFFAFDALDLYHTELGAEAVFDGNGSVGAGKKILGEVLLWNRPKDLSDTVVLRDLGRLGYKRTEIPQENFQPIAELFRERALTKRYETACVAEYRDILIFHKGGKVIGVAKICFGCLQNRIIGTSADTQFFGQDGDYERLREILAHVRSHQRARRA